MGITEEQVLEALKRVYDPEMGINLVDLGLIYSVDILEDSLSIKMTLTAKGCPIHDVMARAVREAALKVAGGRDVDVEVVWDPPWNPDMITEEGRKQLRRR